MARVKANIEKKLISFTKLHLIDKLVKDEAAVENRSESAIIENRLLNSFLPKEINARYWVENCLYAEDGGIGKTLEAIFSSNAAGTNWEAVHDNLLPIVEFAKTQESLCRTKPTGNENELPHFCTQLDSICLKLEDLAEKNTDKKIEYGNEAKWARELLKVAKEEPQFIRYINFYQIVLNSWEALKGWSITYRFLADLAILESGWKDTPEARNELLNIIKNVSQEWTK